MLISFLVVRYPLALLLVLDKAVDRFDESVVGKLAVEPGQDSVPMIFDGFGDCPHLVNLTTDCPGVPLLEMNFGLLASGGEINILEGQLDQISTGRFQSITAESE